MTFKNLRYGLSSSVVLAASLFSVPSYAATDSIGLTVITTVEIGTCTATLVNDSDQDISVVDFGDVYIFLKSMPRPKLKHSNSNSKTVRVSPIKKHK